MQQQASWQVILSSLLILLVPLKSEKTSPLSMRPFPSLVSAVHAAGTFKKLRHLETNRTHLRARKGVKG